MASQETTDEDDDMKDIVEPRETDVLCGRGGAALRHAGNQTYRRLVNLNKGLYITCMKTEKLKISRSIVAAIREQKGRFLERDVKKGVWFDIGDKKAVEKTSQALREGQPKLRKKMVEMGTIPADQASGVIDPVSPSVQQQMLQQYGNGIYNTRVSRPNGSMHGNMNILVNNGMRLESIGSMGSGNSGNSYPSMLDSMQGRLESIGSGNSGNSYPSILDNMQQQQQLQQQQQMMMGRNNTGQLRNSMAQQMPPPPLRRLSNGTSMNSMNGNDMTILQHLSLDSTPQTIPSWTPSMEPSIASMNSLMTMSTADVPQMVSRRNLSRPYNRNPSYGSYNNSINSNNNNNNNNSHINPMQSITSNSSCSNTSNNNDLSDFARNDNRRSIDRNNMLEPNFLCEKIGSFDPTEQPFRQQQQLLQQQQHQPQIPRTRDSFNENNNPNNMTDPTGCSVDDRRRYFAKMKYARKNSPRGLSSQGSIITDGMPDIHMVDSQFSLLSNLSAHGSKHSRHLGQNSTDMEISKHGLTKKDSIGSEYIGVGSRRSLMSGLSKLSGHSLDINNTFSNMSKKITGTNHTISSRSLAMSEFSEVDEEFAEDDFNFDIPTQRNP
jgi:hypothetical protein